MTHRRVANTPEQHPPEDRGAADLTGPGCIEQRNDAALPASYEVMQYLLHLRRLQLALVALLELLPFLRIMAVPAPQGIGGGYFFLPGIQLGQLLAHSAWP